MPIGLSKLSASLRGSLHQLQHALPSAGSQKAQLVREPHSIEIKRQREAERRLSDQVRLHTHDALHAPVNSYHYYYEMAQAKGALENYKLRAPVETQMTVKPSIVQLVEQSIQDTEYLNDRHKHLDGILKKKGYSAVPPAGPEIEELKSAIGEKNYNALKDLMASPGPRIAERKSSLENLRVHIREVSRSEKSSLLTSSNSSASVSFKTSSLLSRGEPSPSFKSSIKRFVPGINNKPLPPLPDEPTLKPPWHDKPLPLLPSEKASRAKQQAWEDQLQRDLARDFSHLKNAL